MAKRNKDGRRQGLTNNNKKSFEKRKAGGGTTSAINKSGTSSTNPNRKIPEGSEGHYRTKATIKRLQMYKDKPDM